MFFRVGASAKGKFFAWPFSHSRTNFPSNGKTRSGDHMTRVMLHPGPWRQAIRRPPCR